MKRKTALPSTRSDLSAQFTDIYALLAQLSLQLYSLALESKLRSFPVYTQRFICNVLNCADKRLCKTLRVDQAL